MKPKSEQDDRTQADKFLGLARELEADEDADHFEDTVRRIAKTPPMPLETKPG